MVIQRYILTLFQDLHTWLHLFTWNQDLSLYPFTRAYLIKRNSVPTVVRKSGKCKTSLKTNRGSLIGQKRANNTSYQAPETLPLALPTPTPSQKQKHVTSGSICLTPPAGREDSQPPETTSVTSSSEVLQRREHTLTQAHSATAVNTRKWEAVYFYWKWNIYLKIPSSKSISQTLYIH